MNARPSAHNSYLLSALSIQINRPRDVVKINKVIYVYILKVFEKKELEKHVLLLLLFQGFILSIFKGSGKQGSMIYMFLAKIFKVFPWIKLKKKIFHNSQVRCINILNKSSLVLPTPPPIELRLANSEVEAVTCKGSFGTVNTLQ